MGKWKEAFQKLKLYRSEEMLGRLLKRPPYPFEEGLKSFLPFTHLLVPP